MAQRADVHIDACMDGQMEISTFYMTFSPIGAAAQKGGFNEWVTMTRRKNPT